MTPDLQLVADIKGAESCSLIAYRDTLGHWTIGYGHELAAAVDWDGHEITQDCADTLLMHDIAEAQGDATSLSEWHLLDTPCRKNALVELVFNMGLGRWLGFRFCRAALAEQNWKEASAQLLDSSWAIQVGKNRSQRLAQYFLTGQYPCP